MFIQKHLNGHKAFVIAEAGSNHDGSYEKACALIEAAAKAGAHAVKFQSFSKEGLVHSKELAAMLNVDAGQFDVIDKIKFQDSWYKGLSALCKEKGLEFMSTPFSCRAIEKLEEIGVRLYKIASCDIANYSLLKEVANTGKSIILSTGLAKEGEIEKALEIFEANECALLHCSVEYPVPAERRNLYFIETLRRRYNRICGLSDHSIGSLSATAAYVLGARIFEKHFTISPKAQGGDHAMSADGGTLKSMIDNINETAASLGRHEKTFSEKEEKELIFARRGLYYKRDMKEGETLSEPDIVALRPARYSDSSQADNFIGRRLTKDRSSMDALKSEDFQ